MRLIKQLVRAAVLKVYHSAQPLGLLVLPKHLYVPIADNQSIRTYLGRTSILRHSLAGVDIDLNRQIQFLRRSIAPYEPEYRGNPYFIEGREKGYGPGYGYIESQCLHGVIRSLRPARIVEVGSGVSTYCTIKAMELNAAEGARGSITCIEPYPSSFIRGCPEIELMEMSVQDVPDAVFHQLEAGDFLFIDTTHTVKPGGDVEHIYTRIIPKLKPGVMVHIHDIFLPYLHQRDLTNSFFQWCETTLLLLLLINNPRLSVILCQSQLHYDSPQSLAEVFPEYIPQKDANGLAESPCDGHFPASIYLMTK